MLLSTAAMCAERYGNPKETVDLLGKFDEYFTLIFIYEMVMKQFAIGINKYLADSMNWLDGFIVLTSTIEYVPIWSAELVDYIEDK